MHRKNTNDRVKLTTLMQARLAWQAAQRFTKPDNATGANPKNDSDEDGCPEVILIEDETEADIQASTPIQDGWGISGDDVPNNKNPDNVKSVATVPWMGHQITKCHFILKQDAIEFMNDHLLGR